MTVRCNHPGWHTLVCGLAIIAGHSLLGSAHAAALTTDAMRDLQLRPGVVLIFIPLSGSIPELGIACPDGAGVLGSGFMFRPDGYLITNGHVAQLANMNDADARQARDEALGQCLFGALKAKFAAQRQARGEPPMSPADQQKLYSLVIQYLSSGKISIAQGPAVLRVCLDNRQCFKGEIKTYSAPFIKTQDIGKDVAIIKVDGHNLPTVPLGNSDSVNVNDPVYVIGYPGDARVSAISTYVATSTDGRISAVKRLDHPDIPVLQTNAVINPGNSGGPAFDAQGRVIGIATFKSGTAYSYLVPINVAMEFVRQAGVAPERGTFDDLWQRALTAFADTRWGHARQLLQGLLVLMPHQPEAERLEHAAAANEGAEGPWQWLIDALGRSGIIASTSAIAAVLGVVAWWLLGPRRSMTPRPPGNRRDLALAKAGQTLEQLPGTAGPVEQFGVLRISAGPLAGQRFAIPRAGLVLGRDPARCAVVLSDDSISKEHAWVVPLNDEVVVIDRGSANGTYVNSPDSARVNKVRLRGGDRIYLGKSSPNVLTYEP